MQRATLHMKPSPLLIISWMITFIVCVWSAVFVYSVVASYRPIPSRGKEHQPPKHEPGEYREKSSILERGSETSPLVVRLAQAPADHSNAAQNEEEADRKANPDWWMAWLTGGLLFVALAQIGLFWWQLNIIRRSQTDTRLAAKAAMRSVKHAEKTSIRQLRAYVGAIMTLLDKKASIDDDGGTYWIKNFGQTPAYEVRSYAKYHVEAGENARCPANLDFGNLEGDSGSVATLHQGQETRVRFYADLESFKTLKSDVLKGYLTLFIFGLIRYKDAFGEPRWTKFCFRFKRGEKPVIEMCEKHNEAD